MNVESPKEIYSNIITSFLALLEDIYKHLSVYRRFKMLFKASRVPYKCLWAGLFIGFDKLTVIVSLLNLY